MLRIKNNFSPPLFTKHPAFEKAVASVKNASAKSDVDEAANAIDEYLKEKDPSVRQERCDKLGARLVIQGHPYAMMYFQGMVHKRHLTITRAMRQVCDQQNLRFPLSALEQAVEREELSLEFQRKVNEVHVESKKRIKQMRERALAEASR